MSDFAPEVGPDGRPRPRFGEYATAEEQRARITQPDVTDALSAGVAPEPIAPAPTAAPTAPAHRGPAPDAAAGVSAPSATRGPASPADRVFTMILLVLGALNVVVSLGGLLDLAGSFTRTMSAMGVPGAFTNTAAAEAWGIVGAVVLVVGYLVTAYVAWRRMRAGRLSWWIPVVGAVLTYAILIACLTVPLAADPAFQEYVGSVS